MFERFSRSWRLVGQCWNVLVDDKAMLIFPIMSCAVFAIISVSFILPVWVVVHASNTLASAAINRNAGFVGLLLFYLVLYSIGTFFNTALASVALKRFDGLPASVSDGLSIAWQRLPSIVGYCLVAATVGALVRQIEERVGFIGRIMVGLFGVTFSVATMLVVPILAREPRGPFEAISESVQLMKRSWGENLIGNAGISAAAGLVTVLIVIVGFALSVMAFATGHFGLGFFLAVLTVLSVTASVLVSSTLHTIYTAALYRFARGEDGGRYFQRDLLDGAFTPRS
jgi:hypothetical protein